VERDESRCNLNGIAGLECPGDRSFAIRCAARALRTVTATRTGGDPSPLRLTLTLCLAEVLTMFGVFAFPALLPDFADAWQLTNTDAGWIAGIYFAGYALSVPVLVSLTDRVDARVIYVASAVTTALSSFGFALFADGFWSALWLRALAGVGLAGTYMPGLRVLVDRYRGRAEARAIGFYTATFSLGTSLSYLVIGVLAAWLDWRWAFAIAGGVALLGALLVSATLPAMRPHAPPDGTRLLDFRPVLRNRPAMGYVLAYGVHTGELFAMRSWLVAFLVYSAALTGSEPGLFAPTVVATLSGLTAMVASLAGNEAAVRYGSRRVVTWVIVASAAVACAVGFSAPLAYGWVVVLVLLYSVTIQLDSAALTAGAVAHAEPGRRGATLAMHSLIGFGGGFVGPLLFGVILDAWGGESIAAWGAAFATIGLLTLLGPLALWRLSR
jgi:MFS family permease